jgi:hypothetical protein
MVVLHELDLSIGSRGDHFRFGLVFFLKSNQTEFFKKKLKPVQTDWF